MDEEVGPGLDARYLEALRERIRNSSFHRWAGLELVSIVGRYLTTKACAMGRMLR